MKAKGIGAYLKGFAEPIFILLPLNIIGELATPISLSFRLFGNILGGVIIMYLLYSAVPVLIPILPHIYFDLFAGILQTFIFVMLSMVFISLAMD
jgi:F-type H+-transporting ATPase subunit a